MEKLASLNTRIGTEWHQLGIELGFENSQLEQLREAYPYSISDCVSSLLHAWCEVVLCNVTDPWSALSKALISVNRRDLAEEFTSGDEVDGGTDGTITKGITAQLREVQFKRSSSKIQEYIDQSLKYMKFKKKNQHLFVHTAALDHVTSWFKSRRSVLIAGNAGDGKSSIAVNLLSSLQEEGYTVIVLSDPALLEQVYDSNIRIVYFIDDAFGTPTMKRSLVDIWIRLHDKIQGLIEEKQCGLVLTSRKLVYHAAVPCFLQSPCYTDNVIDLTDEKLLLSFSEKEAMAVRHFESSGNDVCLSRYLRSISTTYTPGFPFLCRMHSNKNLLDSSDLSYSPLTLMKQEMHILSQNEPSTFCGLLLVAILDGKLPRDFFDPFESIAKEEEVKTGAIMRAYGLDPYKDKQDILKHMESMVGVYIEEMGGDFVFLHDVIFDSLCLIFGQRSPSEVLRISSSEFISERIRTEDSDGVDEKDVIILKKPKYPLLAKRWVKDMMTNNVSDVYDNPSFRDDAMFNVFMEEILTLSEDDLWHLICIKDKKRGHTYLKLAGTAGFEDIAVNIMGKIHMENRVVADTEKDILSLALYETAESGYWYLVKALLSLKVVNVNASYAPSKRQCLHNAAMNGYTQIVEALLTHGADVSSSDRYGINPLHYACGSGSIDCVRILVQHGADINARDRVGRLPVHYACTSNNFEVLKFLHNHQATLHVADLSNRFPIHFAAQNNCSAILEYLVNEGCSVNASDNDLTTPLHLAGRRANVKNFEILLSNKADPNSINKCGNYPLHLICETQHKQYGFECVKLLIESLAKVNVTNINGATPLQKASAWPNDSAFSVVKLLLQHQANPNALDLGNWSPLMSACASGSSKTVRLLLEYDADPFICGLNGTYPIHIACQHDSAESLIALLDSSISIEIEDHKGRQPIHIASQYGNLKCLSILMDRGACVNAGTVMKMTPLHFACRAGKVDIVRLLMENGANPALKTRDGDTAEEVISKFCSDKTKHDKMKKYLNQKSMKE